MPNKFNLKRFTNAHQEDFETALGEIKDGKKQSHWMWYIFPQLKGLGMSPTAQFYGIENIDEAKAFLNDPYLGENLRQISQELTKLETNDPIEVFGPIDALKLKSSMTLFAHADSQEPIFKKVLKKYYDGEEDQKTLELLR